MIRRVRRDGEGTNSAGLNRSTSKKLIAKAFGQQVFFRVLGMISNILTVTVTTRYLGPVSYGALTTSIVFVGLWTSLTELGIGSVIVRRVMSGNGSLERLVRINIGMSLIYALPLAASAALSGMAVYYGHGDIAKMTVIVSISLILTTLSSCFTPIFVASLRFAAVSAADLLSRLASLAFTLLLVHHAAGLIWFATVQILPAVVVLAVQASAASRIVPCKPIFHIREARELIIESLPQTGVLVIGVLYWRLDGVILSLVSTQTEVGVYGLAYSLAFTISVLPTFFASSTLSGMTHLYAVDNARFARFAMRSLELMMFLGFPLAIAGSICAPRIVRIVGSEEFVAKGGPTLAIFLVAAVVGFLTGVLSQALFASHDQIFLLRLNAVNLVLNIGLNVVLAPAYGAVGSAVAMVVTECSGLLFANWRLSRRTDYRTPWTFLVRLLIPTGLCAAVGWGLYGLSILILLPGILIVYLAVNALIGPVDVRNVKALIADRR